MQYTYIKINNPKIYYHNINLLGKLFRQYGGNPMYYISEYRNKIRDISNKEVFIEEDMFTYVDNIIELLDYLDSFLKENL